MFDRHLGKVLLLLALLCALCVMLSGCIVDPDGQEEPQSTSAWRRFDESPSPEPVTPEPEITATPDPNLQSWDEPTPDPDAQVTPTPTSTPWSPAHLFPVPECPDPNCLLKAA